MSFNRLKVPQLILVQPFCLSLFMIDFNGPAMASDARQPRALPRELIANVVSRAVTQIRVVIVDDQTLSPKRLDAQRRTEAPIVFDRSLVAKGDALKDRRTSLRDGRLMFLLERSGEFIEALPSSFPEHRIIGGQSAHIGQLQRLAHELTKAGLSVP